MAGRIEDYALIGDTTTVALVDRAGSVDWWCVPRIDGGACFAALLGTPDHGRWLIAPTGRVRRTTRRYEDDTLVLETVHETDTGTVAVIDLMPVGLPHPAVHRVVEGRDGAVELGLELVVRFDHGAVTPWVRSTGDGLTLVAGPDALRFHSPVPLEGVDHRTRARFTVAAGQRLSFSLSWYPATEADPVPVDGLAALHRTRRWWREWVSRCTWQGGWRDEVVRSLITLKALTYAPTGAVVAAATTSLPEQVGGGRNWDYRYSWLRDATMTLQVLLAAGYREEAAAWSAWLRRAVAGSPGEFQIMYGVGGERRLTEFELDHLPGYEGSRPVRVGNGAATQFQLDVFGEVMDTALLGVEAGLHGPAGTDGELVLALMEHLEAVWDQPDEGIWEVRGPRRHFTHSKVMAWVAFDRAVRLAERSGRHGPHVGRWRALADRVHAEVCEQGWDPGLGSFTQSYGSGTVDASLLLLAPVGFLPPEDPRVAGTVAAVERELVVDGFVRRYRTDVGDPSAGPGGSVDGLAGDEGAFLITTFWLADNLALLGRPDEAVDVFERLLSLRNDVGLLAEEYDPVAGRLLGNFPQAFSHIGLVQTAANLSAEGPSPTARRAAR